jgi:hypothetical protein
LAVNRSLIELNKAIITIKLLMVYQRNIKDLTIYRDFETKLSLFTLFGLFLLKCIKKRTYFKVAKTGSIK